MSDWPFEDEDAPTAEELAEAQALAAMLDGGGAEGVSEQTQQTAALLGFAADGATLPKERSRNAMARFSAVPRRRVGYVAVGVALAAAAAVLLYARQPPGQLPSPSARLLQAQARAARGDAPEVLDDALQAHRRELLGALRGVRQ